MGVWTHRRRAGSLDLGCPLGAPRTLGAPSALVATALAGLSALVGLSVAALPAVAAPAVVASAAAAPAAPFASGTGTSAPVFPTLTSRVDPLTDGTVVLDSLACPTARSCVAVGLDRGAGPVGGPGEGVVLPIDDGVAGTVIDVPGTSVLRAVACSTPSACVAVGSPSGDNPGSSATAVVPIDGAVPATVQYLPATININGVACPNATTCEAVGFTVPSSSPASAEQAVVVPISGGVAGTAETVLGVSALEAISCPDSVDCDALGVRYTNGNSQDLLLPIVAGVPGLPNMIPGSAELTALACPTTSLCVVAGYRPAAYPNPVPGFLMAVRNGVAQPPQPVPGGADISNIGCFSATTCLAVANVNVQPTLSYQSSVLPVIDGVEGSPVQVPGVQNLGPIACTTATQCALIGGTTTPYGAPAFNAKETLTTVTFGTASGATLTYPPNGAIGVDTTQPYTWTAAAGATAYDLLVGTSPFTANVFTSGVVAPTRASVEGPSLPVGPTLYATLLTEVGATWSYQWVSFTAQPGLATFAAPANGATGVDPTQVLRWSPVTGAQAYIVIVGTGQYTTNFLNSGVLPATTTSVGVPLYQMSGIVAGEKLFASVFTKVDGAFSRVSSTSYTVRAPYATMTRPSNGQTGVATPATFTWTPIAGAQAYMLWVGSSPLAQNLVAANAIPAAASSYAVAAMPHSTKLYATVLTEINGNWYYQSVTFTTS